MQHAQRFPSSSPWRAATFAVGALAALELLGLLALAGVRLAPARHSRVATATHTTSAAPKPHVETAPLEPLRPRASATVLVLNGNGVAGAAATAAQRLRLEGYRIGGAANAHRHDYARSMVMYVPGWAREARRLGHDADVRAIAPLDGLTQSRLRGSKLVLLLGT